MEEEKQTSAPTLKLFDYKNEDEIKEFVPEEDDIEWESEHPLFMTKLPEDIESNPSLAALQAMKYDNKSPEELADSYKEKGNECFRKGPKYIKVAIQWYTKAILENIQDKERISLYYTNRATAHFELKNYRNVVDDCVIAIENNPLNSKAYFRAAKACSELEKFDEAFNFIDDGLRQKVGQEPLTKLRKDIEKRSTELRIQREEQERRRKLREEIEREREREMLRKLTNTNPREERVEWMYQAPLELESKVDEEFTVPKEVKGLDSTAVEITNTNAVPGSKFINDRMLVTEKNESVQGLNEDPLDAIKRKEEERIKAVLENPEQLKILRETILKERLEKDLDRKKKKKDKTDKKDKKSKKDKPKKRKERDYDNESKRIYYSEQDEEKKIRKHEDIETMKYEEKRFRGNEKNRDNYKRERNISPDDYKRGRDVRPDDDRRERYRSPDDYKRRRDRSPDDYRRERDISPDNYKRRRDRSPDDYKRSRDRSPDDYRRERDRSYSEYKTERNRNRDYYSRDYKKKYRDNYGDFRRHNDQKNDEVSHGNQASYSYHNRDDFGRITKGQNNKNDSYQPKQLSQEEKNRLLEQMKVDAQNYQKESKSRILKEEQTENEQTRHNPTKELQPKFINEALRSVYDHKSASLSERLSRSKQFIEKDLDM